MHFIYQINRLTPTKVDSTYLGSLANNAQCICPVAGLERMTTGSVPYRATQVDKVNSKKYFSCENFKSSNVGVVGIVPSKKFRKKMDLGALWCIF